MTPAIAAAGWPAGEEFAIRHVTINGQDVGYRLAGRGPLIVLIHGLAGSSVTWRRVGPPLAAHHTVLAVDLLGHGESGKPRGDYSLGAHASGIRDLMMTLGLDAATFVGHSLGGGIAMVLAYQFPELCQRLVLVASGGLGKEVTPVLRAASLPGAELVLPVVLSGRVREVLVAAGSPFRRIGLRLGGAPLEWWNHYASLTTREARVAFLSTVREVVDLRGQRVSAADRLYLAAELPTLIVWGDRDGVIPVAHAHQAHAALPGSRLEILEGSGHFIPVHDGERLADLIADFIATTEPASTNGSAFRAALRRGASGAAVVAPEAAVVAPEAAVVAPVTAVVAAPGEGVVAPAAGVVSPLPAVVAPGTAVVAAPGEGVVAPAAGVVSPAPADVAPGTADVAPEAAVVAAPAPAGVPRSRSGSGSAPTPGDEPTDGPP